MCYPSTKFPPCLNLKHNYFKHPLCGSPGAPYHRKVRDGGVGQGCWPRGRWGRKSRVLREIRKACEESWDLDTECLNVCVTVYPLGNLQIRTGTRGPAEDARATSPVPSVRLPPQRSVFSLCGSQPCPGHSWPCLLVFQCAPCSSALGLLPKLFKSPLDHEHFFSHLIINSSHPHIRIPISLLLFFSLVHIYTPGSISPRYIFLPAQYILVECVNLYGL